MQVFVYGSLRAGGWYQQVIEPYVDVREPAWLEGFVGPGNPQNEYETEGYPQVPDGDWIRHWQHRGGEFTCR
jgi:hypothetical protein